MRVERICKKCGGIMVAHQKKEFGTCILKVKCVKCGHEEVW